MTEPLQLPFLKNVVPSGLTFGANYLVEFEPHSLWYETSLTLAGEALRQNFRTDYHTFSHLPGEVRDSLSRLGVNIRGMEEADFFRVIDTFTVTTGIGSPERKAGSMERFQSKSIRLLDWAEGAMHEIRDGVPEVEKERLHLDDNLSVLTQYNDEKTVVDYWRTRFVPWSRSLRLSVIHSLTTGTHSASFYNQFEALCDGIFDFKAREENGRMENYFRARSVRGRPHDSRWKRLHVKEDGRVVFDTAEKREKALGIRGWIKGPR